MSFSSARLSIARKRRMLNKKELSEACSVAQHTVVRWEKGEAEPSEDNIALISSVLRFPREFFYGPDLEEPISASFRSQTSMSAGVRDAALSAGSIGFLLSDWTEARFNLPEIVVPDLHLYEPEHAARVLREEWKLGEKPISNMIHLLESKGVRVFSLAENTVKVNAYSLWRDEKPYIFLNNYKSAESSRFDAAHELGHLVLHQDGAHIGREAEDQAHRFAGAFLMPRAGVLAAAPKVDYYGQVLNHKKQWKVSAAAFVYRIHKLQIISDWRYRDFCIELSKRGHNRNEPQSIDRERSVVWEKVLRSLWSEKITLSDVAQYLAVPHSEISGLVFGIVSQQVEPPRTRVKLAAV